MNGSIRVGSRASKCHWPQDAFPDHLPIHPLLWICYLRPWLTLPLQGPSFYTLCSIPITPSQVPLTFSRSPPPWLGFPIPFNLPHLICTHSDGQPCFPENLLQVDQEAPAMGFLRLPIWADLASPSRPSCSRCQYFNGRASSTPNE